MTTLSAILEESHACGVYVLDSVVPLGRLQQLAQKHRLEFLVLDGKQVQSKEEFLDHAAFVSRFPDYFGKNWDALADCLTDMSWLESEGFLILYSDYGNFAEHARDEFDTAVEIFREAADFWQKEGKTFVVLLYDTPAREWGLPLIGLEPGPNPE